MKVLCYDIETMQELFLINILDPEMHEQHEFMVSKWHNNLDVMINFINEHKDFYFVGYNNLLLETTIIGMRRII